MLAKEGVTECECRAHARSKYFDLHEANKSQIAADALKLFGQFYEVEREVKDLDAQARREVRQAKAKPIADAPAGQPDRRVAAVPLGAGRGQLTAKATATASPYEAGVKTGLPAGYGEATAARRHTGLPGGTCRGKPSEGFVDGFGGGASRKNRINPFERLET